MHQERQTLYFGSKSGATKDGNHSREPPSLHFSHSVAYLITLSVPLSSRSDIFISLSLAIISNLSYHSLSVEFILHLYCSLLSVLLSLLCLFSDILNKDTHFHLHPYIIGPSQRKTWHILSSCLFYSIISRLIPKFK